ncbi:antibiotic biosynthesis monooxygenase [Microbulbifer sp. OS29]|uniref:Antibiotic biosynthesis monooxygenase n=1 Tax=Microbulbifer okhotskensis TaxID=2926617 RepID=A0A9X2ES53_9GAMM|nr:putative quinol monooxygenase [Microbulbifer okhotskensis]MCO1336806.1 antibiotic biosynthesis monooxygenase [Microbulbifer okhotskensis]
MKTPVLVFASFHPKQGKEEDVKDILMEMVVPSRAERGNLIYEFCEQVGTKNKEKIYHLIEKYEDKSALDQHKISNHYTNYRKNIEALLSRPIGVTDLKEIR